MRFRELGRTGLRISAVGLGGHWRTPDGRRYLDHLPDDDDIPADLVNSRAEVVAFCRDAGVNYIDITTAAECSVYGRALAGCRDRFIVGADDYQWSARNREAIAVPALIANVERCLTRLRTDHLDIWRVISEVHGHNTADEMRIIVEAADRLRQAGKIRHFGVSAHHAGWLARTLRACDAIEVVLTPSVPPGLSLIERAADDASDDAADVRAQVCRRGIGAIGIKPFAGGALFTPHASTRATDPKCLRDARIHDRLARLVLQRAFIDRPEFACIVPGMSSVAEARAALAALNAKPLDAADRRWLDDHIQACARNLPAEYQWLADWSPLPHKPAISTAQAGLPA